MSYFYKKTFQFVVCLKKSPYLCSSFIAMGTKKREKSHNTKQFKHY